MISFKVQIHYKLMHDYPQQNYSSIHFFLFSYFHCHTVHVVESLNYYTK